MAAALEALEVLIVPERTSSFRPVAVVLDVLLTGLAAPLIVLTPDAVAEDVLLTVVVPEAFLVPDAVVLDVFDIAVAAPLKLNDGGV